MRAISKALFDQHKAEILQAGGKPVLFKDADGYFAVHRSARILSDATEVEGHWISLDDDNTKSVHIVEFEGDPRSVMPDHVLINV